MAHPDIRRVRELLPGQGPVTSFGYLHDRHEGPFVAYAQGPAPTAGGTPVLHGSAADTSRERAGAKAILELLERGCAMTRPRAPVRHGAPCELVSAITDGSEPDTPRWWVEARSMRDGRPWLVESDHFVLASQSGRGDSTGLAVGHDLHSSAVRGLLEAVERKAVDQLANGYPVRPCPTGERTGPGDSPYAGALDRDGWTVEAVATVFAGFPVALCVATDTTGRSVGGCAARASLREAVDAAASEAYMKSIAWTSRSARSVNASSAALDDFRLRDTLVFGEVPPDPAGARDPVAVLDASTLDALVVDRGNPMLDALGLRAAHVLLRPQQRQVTPEDDRAPEGRRLEELLR